jgi:hypothetical protein
MSETTREAAATRGSGAGRVLGVLVAPGETFRALAIRPTWVAPLLVLVATATVLGFMVSERIDIAQLMRHQNEVTGNQMSVEQLDQRIQQMQKLQPYLALFQGLIFLPGFYLLAALLFWVGLKLVGSDLGYKASLATSLHAFLPLAVLSLLCIPVVWNRASFTPEEARSGSFLASNLAVLAPDGTGKVVHALLVSVDLFSIWTIVLLVVGYGIVGRVSRAAATGVVLAVWLLWVALKVAFVALAPG